MSKLERRRDIIANMITDDGTIKSSDIVLNLPLSGNTTDISGNNHVVTDNSIIYYPDGALFDTNTDYIKVNDSVDLTFAGGSTDRAFSIEISFITLSTGIKQLVGKVEGTFAEYQVLYYNDTILFLLYHGGNSGGGIYKGVQTNVLNLISGNINNVIVTYNGTSGNNGMKIYLNGIIQTTSIFNSGSYVSMVDTTASVLVGYADFTNTRTIIGSIKNVKVYKIALSQLQVTNLQTISPIEASTTKLFVPFYGNISDKSNNTKSLVSGGSAYDYLTKPRWLKSGTDIYQQITSNITDLSFYSGTTDLPFSISFKYNFAYNSNVSWFNKSNGTNVEYSIKYDTVLGIAVVLRDNNNNAEYNYNKSFTPLLGQNYLFAVTYGSGIISLYINGILQTPNVNITTQDKLKTNLLCLYEMDDAYNGSTSVFTAAFKDLTLTTDGTISLTTQGSIDSSFRNTGVINYAINFNLSGHYLTLTNGRNFSTAKVDGSGDRPISINMWVKLNSLVGTNHLCHISSPTNVWNEGTYTFKTVNNLVYFLLMDGYGNNVISVYGTIPSNVAGNFAMFTVSYSGSVLGGQIDNYGIKIAINGNYIPLTSPSSTTYIKATNTNVALILYNWLNTGNNNLMGDQFGFWYKELSQSEIYYLYQNGSGKAYVNWNYVSMSPLSGGTQQVNITRRPISNNQIVNCPLTSSEVITTYPTSHDYSGLNHYYGVDPTKIDSIYGSLYDGSNPYDEIASSSDLVFGNGTTDLPFSFSVKTYMTAIPSNDNACFIQTLSGYGFVYRYGYLHFYLSNSDGANLIGFKVPFTISTLLNSSHTVGFTYDGSKSIGGVKIYVDGVIQTDLTISSEFTVGTYTGMGPTAQKITIGRNGGGAWNYTGYLRNFHLDNTCHSKEQMLAYYNEPNTFEFLNGSIKNLKVESIAIPHSSVVKYANDAESYRVLDMQFNGSNVKHGYLYNWFAVGDVRNIAPIGWHVPTNTEWQTLIDYASSNFGTSLSTGKSLAAKYNWSTDNGVNTIGNNQSINNFLNFNGQPAGWRSDTWVYTMLNQVAMFWTSSPGSVPSISAYAKNLYYTTGGVNSNDLMKGSGGSIRCIKDNNIPTVGGITYDIDGNSYTEVVIGTQIWMVQNLATTKYRDGSSIPNVTNSTTWSNLNTGALCSYNNDMVNVFASEDYINNNRTITDTTIVYSKNNALFNGSTSKITISNSSDLIFTDGTKDLPFTIDIRFTFNSNTGVQMIFSKGTSSVLEMGMWYNSGTLYFALYDKTNIQANSRQINKTVTLVNGVSYRVTITYKPIVGNTGMIMYINNIQQTLSWVYELNYTTIQNSLPTNITLGKHEIWDAPFNGTIDYCTLYNRVLILDEIVNGIQNTYDTVTDIDGNVYNTMTINGKTWMVENLRTTHYRDGSSIDGIMQYPGKEQISGKLYTKTHANSLNIAPLGWHVATYAEWTSVSMWNGFGQLVNMGIVKTSDASGINYYGSYIQPTSGWWWLTNEYSGFIISVEPLTSATGNGYLSQYMTDWGPTHGMAIRCVKD